MEEINNSHSGIEDSDSSGSSIQLIGKKIGSRRRDSNEKIVTNNSVGRKRTRNPAKWDRNVQKHKRIKGLRYRNRSGNVIPEKTFVDHHVDVVRSATEK